MKNLKNTGALWAIVCLITLTAMNCKKDKDNGLDADGLPKATQTGAMLFACKVNGQNWIAKRSIYRMGGGVKKDTLVVWAKNENYDYDTFFLYVLNSEARENITYRLNDINQQFGQYRTTKDCFFMLNNGFGIGKSIDGELIFTKINKATTVISGTFWFTVVTDKCDTLKITHGRFDINIGNANFSTN